MSLAKTLIARATWKHKILKVEASLKLLWTLASFIIGVAFLRLVHQCVATELNEWASHAALDCPTINCEDSNGTTAKLLLFRIQRLGLLGLVYGALFLD